MPASSVPDSVSDAVWPARLDVRAKMLVCFACALCTVCLTSLWSQVLLFSVSLVYLLATRRVRVILGAYLLMTLMMLCAFGCAKAMVYFVPSLEKGLHLSGIAVPFLRGATMMNIVLPLAFTSRVQNVLNALKSLRLPFFLYVPAAVMIRFIPTFTDDIRQIRESLRIRGWRLTPARLLRAPADTVRCLFAPLVVRALRSADDLGVAAELKGLSPAVRRAPASAALPWQFADRAFLAAAALTAVAAVLLQIVGPEFKGGML